MTKVFPTRWWTGASMGPQKPLCHRNLWLKTILYIYTLTTLKKQVPPQKKTFQNGGQWSILFRTISISAKIWKNTFPKEFFNGIWVMVLVENHIFPHPPKYWFMLISEKTTGFFFLLFICLFLFFILFCFVWFFDFYLFIYLFNFLFFIFYFFIFYFFFLASKEGYPWRWHLKVAPVKNFDMIVKKFRGLRKTVVGTVGTPSLVRLSHVLGVNIKCWYDHFDTRVLVS